MLILLFVNGVIYADVCAVITAFVNLSGAPITVKPAGGTHRYGIPDETLEIPNLSASYITNIEKTDQINKILQDLINNPDLLNDRWEFLKKNCDAYGGFNKVLDKLASLTFDDRFGSPGGSSIYGYDILNSKGNKICHIEVAYNHGFGPSHIDSNYLDGGKYANKNSKIKNSFKNWKAGWDSSKYIKVLAADGYLYYHTKQQVMTEIELSVYDYIFFTLFVAKPKIFVENFNVKIASDIKEKVEDWKLDIILRGNGKTKDKILNDNSEILDLNNEYIIDKFYKGAHLDFVFKPLSKDQLRYPETFSFIAYYDDSDKEMEYSTTKEFIFHPHDGENVSIKVHNDEEEFQNMPTIQIKYNPKSAVEANDTKTSTNI